MQGHLERRGKWGGSNAHADAKHLRAMIGSNGARWQIMRRDRQIRRYSSRWAVKEQCQICQKSSEEGIANEQREGEDFIYVFFFLI